MRATEKEEDRFCSLVQQRGQGGQQGRRPSRTETGRKDWVRVWRSPSELLPVLSRVGGGTKVSAGCWEGCREQRGAL